MNEVERRGCVALEALEPCSSRLLQPCHRQPPLCAVRAALLVVAAPGPSACWLQVRWFLVLSSILEGEEGGGGERGAALLRHCLAAGSS